MRLISEINKDIKKLELKLAIEYSIELEAKLEDLYQELYDVCEQQVFTTEVVEYDRDGHLMY